MVVDVNARLSLLQRKGRTALIWASIEGLAKVVGKLLDAGADKDARDNVGCPCNTLLALLAAVRMQGSPPLVCMNGSPQVEWW